MDWHGNPPDLEAPPLWLHRPRVRKVARLTFALLLTGLLVGGAVWTSTGGRENDRYYLVYVSILRAEKLAKVCVLKSPDPRSPMAPSDLGITEPCDLADAWGNPYKWAVVPDAAGDPELYIWSEWVRDDGTTTLIGAKVRPDGSSDLFGLPPKD